MGKKEKTIYNKPGTFAIIDVETGDVVSCQNVRMRFRSLSIARSYLPKCQYIHLNKKLVIKQLKPTFTQTSRLANAKDDIQFIELEGGSKKENRKWNKMKN